MSEDEARQDYTEFQTDYPDVRGIEVVDGEGVMDLEEIPLFAEWAVRKGYGTLATIARADQIKESMKMCLRDRPPGSQ